MCGDQSFGNTACHSFGITCAKKSYHIKSSDHSGYRAQEAKQRRYSGKHCNDQQIAPYEGSFPHGAQFQDASIKFTVARTFFEETRYDPVYKPV